MQLQAELRCGVFGDPALFVRLANTNQAFLVDCGDLRQFSVRELNCVSHLFLSHCHIDHFFDFDHLLRVNVGSKKCIYVLGPKDLALRVEAKLQSYTWNLSSDLGLEFCVIELDPSSGTQTEVCFHARNKFLPSLSQKAQKPWNPKSPVLIHHGVTVRASELDHRTPSMAYSFESESGVRVNSKKLESLELKPGPWIGQLQIQLNKNELEEFPSDWSGPHQWDLQFLAQELLEKKAPVKIAYATDGGAQDSNREKLYILIQGADQFFSETCFLEKDRNLADATQHFTARFISTLANDAQVKSLTPFHFSKRYTGKTDEVYAELRSYFSGTIQILSNDPSHQRSQKTF